MSMTAKSQLLDLSFKTNRLSPIQCSVAVSWERLRLPTVYLFQLLMQNHSWWLSFLVTSQYKKNITSCPALCMECIVYSLGAHSCVFSNPAAFMLRPVSSWHCKTWSNNRRAEDEAASAPAHPCVYGKFTNDLLIHRCPDDVFWLFFFAVCFHLRSVCFSVPHMKPYWQICGLVIPNLKPHLPELGALSFLPLMGAGVKSGPWWCRW